MNGTVIKKVWGTACAACAVLALLGTAGREDRVLRVADRSTITLAGMAAELAPARAVFIGELHHVAEHHRIQLDVIRALHRSGVPVALGLEMFRSGQQEVLDQWTAGTLGEQQFRRTYERNWTLPWELYRDIFLFARENRIPLVGLNVPDDLTRKVARNGFASLTDEDLKRLPQGISCEVDDTYREFIRRSHGIPGHGGQSFQHFCEAQLVWDKVMALNIADRLRRDPGRTVVVLAGSGHAWRRGIPAQLRQLAPDVRSAVVMPLIDGKITPERVTADDADFVVL
jgi:uncharacterized iron-regulated protein